MPHIRPVLAIALTFASVASCSSSEAEVVTEPTETVDTASATSMRGLRYCEVLLLNLTESGLQAEVYNTYPLNDCPEDTWRGLDGGAIAAAAGVPFALINGPRHWLMDAVERIDDGSVITKTFSGSSGTIDMNRYAVVTLGTPDTVGQAYTPQTVDRKSRFTFRAGSTIFVLNDPNGARFIMQSWSSQQDPQLSMSDLERLGDRLDLPNGWSYTAEVLDADLILDSTTTPARVLQDELMNSYSLMTQ